MKTSAPVTLALALALASACGASFATPHDPGPCGDHEHGCPGKTCCPEGTACGRPGTADEGYCVYVGAFDGVHHPRTQQRRP